jgi:predicted transcriptional regulator
MFPEKFTENETQRRILEMMLANPKVSRDAIATQIGITTRAIQKNINARLDSPKSHSMRLIFSIPS